MIHGPRPRSRLSIVALVVVLAAALRADQLRNVQPGQPLPPFECAGLDGRPVASRDVAGQAWVLVYLSARQRQSEEAIASAHRVTKRIGHAGLKLIYMSADLDQADYFRQLRDRVMAHEPFALDEGRKYYGDLGLIAFPTTVVASKDGKLLHVIAGWMRDYEYRLDLYSRHALGKIDDAELAKRLAARPQARDDARAKADRLRAMAAVLRSKGMLDGAARELEQALKVNPDYADVVVDLADVLVAQGKIDEAEQRITELLAREPRYPAARLLMGLIALKRDQLDEAEKLLKEALIMNPDPVRAHYYLAQLYEKRGDYKSAMEHYREALKRVLSER